MATSLPILQFEPFMMEDSEKLNLVIRWKDYFIKFENFLVAMNTNEDKTKMLHLGWDYIQDIVDNVVPKVEGHDAAVESFKPKKQKNFWII